MTDTKELRERLRAPIPTRVVGYTPISRIREVDWDWQVVEAQRAEAASAIERLEAERDAILEIAEDLRRKHPMRWKIDIIEAAEAQRDQLAEALRIAEAVLRHHPTPFSTTDGGAIPLTSASEAAERARAALDHVEGVE